MQTKIMSFTPEARVRIVAQKARVAGTYRFFSQLQWLEESIIDNPGNVSSDFIGHLVAGEEVLLESLALEQPLVQDSGLLDLFRDTDGELSVGFSVVKNGRHVNSSIQIDSSNVHHLWNRRVVLNGYPDRIYFRRNESISFSAGLQNIFRKIGRSSAEKQQCACLDSFGNLIQHEPAFTVIDLRQSYEDDTPADYAPVSLDLTTLGLGLYDGILAGKVYKTASVIDDIFIYNTSPEPVPVHLVCRLIESGKSAERLFGLPPRAALKRVHILHHTGSMFRGSEAYTHPCSPGTVFLQIEDVKCYSALETEKAGVHETVHLIDFVHGISEHPLFIRLYRGVRRNRRFLRFIKESNFFGLKRPFGHPESNASELLASLVNTVIDDQHWRVNTATRYPDSSSDVIECYCDSLCALRDVVQDVSSERVVPLITLMNRRIADLTHRSHQVPVIISRN